MAGKGTYAAYAPLKGIQDNVSDNLRHAEHIGFRYREEEARKQERKRERLSTLAKEMGTDMSELQFKDSGVKSVDAPLYEYFSKTRKEVADLYKKIEENPDDFESRILLEKRMGSAKTIAGFTQRYAEWQQDYKAGMAGGGPDGKPLYSGYLNRGLPEKINQSLLNGKYKILNDKNGDLQLFVDMDGDGKMDDDFAAINVQEFITGNELYTPAKATDRYAAMDAIAGRFGTVEVEEDEDGYRTTKYKGFDPGKTEDLYKEVNGLLGANIESMTNEAKSIIADNLQMDPDGMSEEQFKEFKDDFSEAIINKFNKSESNTKNYSAQESALNRAQRERQLQGKYDKDTNDKDTVQLRLDKDGAPIYSEVDGGFEYSFPEGNAPAIGEQTAVSTVLNPNTGKVSFVVNVPVYEGEGKDRKVVELKRETVLNDSQVNDYVRQIYNPETKIKFKNQKEYSDFLKKSQYKAQGYGSIDDLPDFE